MTHLPSGVRTQLLTVELSLWSSRPPQPRPVLSVPPGDGRLQECEARAGPVPTVPNDCTHKKGFNSLSQLSPHTLACKEKTAQDSLNQPLPSPPLATLNPDPPPHCIHPRLPPAPTFLLTPAACIKDPSEVSLATFTSERDPIMERLGRRMRRQRGTHRCGGGWGGGGCWGGGAASHCCPPPPMEGRKKGGLGRGEEVK